MNQTHYEVLHLAPDATADEIRSAYRELIQVWHPDRLTSDKLRARATTVVVSLNEAYRVLSDTTLRHEYDSGLLHVVSARRDAEVDAANHRSALRAEIAELLNMAGEIEREIPLLRQQADQARKRAGEIERRAVRDGFFPSSPRGSGGPHKPAKDPSCGRCGGPRRVGDAYCPQCS